MKYYLISYKKGRGAIIHSVVIKSDMIQNALQTFVEEYEYEEIFAIIKFEK